MPVGVDLLTFHRDLVGLPDDVQHDRQPHADEHGVLQGDHHREDERDDEHGLLHQPGSPD